MGTELKTRTNQYEMDMCTGPLMRKLVSFSIPLMLTLNLQLLFNAVDVIVVGKFTGSLALAAVGSTTALINLLINLMAGISMGTSVLVGRFFAVKDNRAVEEVTHTSITFAVVAGIVMAAAGIAFSGQALRWMDTPANVYDQSLLYIRVYFLGTPFFTLYTYGAAVLRAVGDTKRPLMFLILAGVINAGLNMVMVICFHMGVLGVAVATVVSQMISCVLVVRCLLRVKGAYRLDFRKLNLRMPYLKQILQIGLPAGLQSMVINFSNVLLQSSVNSLGETAMAGYTAANNIFGFLFATGNAFSQTCMSFISQNYGVRQWRRMDQVLRDCLLLSVGTMILLGGGTYVFSSQVLGIYTPDPEVIECGRQIFLYSTSTYFICTIMDLLPSAIRGMGYSAAPMFLSVLGTVGVRVIWIYGVFPRYHTLSALFFSYPLSWLVTVLMQLVCLVIVRKKVYASMR